jgi:small subunit ribosomal protein S16
VIRLRLRRMGAKKRPSYRIVAADQKSPRDGRFIETIGYYDPLTEPATVKINEERARHWLSVGAQPSDTVGDLLRRAGITRDAAVTTNQQSAEPAAV